MRYNNVKEIKKMDKETQQQIIYIKTFLGQWLEEGPILWNCETFLPINTDLFANGRYLNTKELSDYAVQQKREKNYAVSLALYFKIISTYKIKTGEIPVDHIRGLYKVLLCVNELYFAFILASTVLSDMNKIDRVDPEEYMFFQEYYSSMVNLAFGDYSILNIYSYIKNFSGDNTYELLKGEREIKKEIEMIKERCLNTNV